MTKPMDRGHRAQDAETTTLFLHASNGPCGSQEEFGGAHEERCRFGILRSMPTVHWFCPNIGAAAKPPPHTER
ncbi:MAG: hypothetical protein IJ131_03290, partial [Eggerthellaceae bacterium]|nr:hypothetical protein [Eggerthellaceae bacterium]